MSRWIAVDWGTSFFRAYLIEDELVSDKIETIDGMKFIQQNDFERKFISLIEKWLIRDHVVEVFARQLCKQGRKVAILSRGYKSKSVPFWEKMWQRISNRSIEIPPKIVSLIPPIS